MRKADAAQAQIHAPFADLTPIPRFLDGLGAELRQRMEEAGVSGGLPGVQMLSDFLFGKAGPGGGQQRCCHEPGQPFWECPGSCPEAACTWLRHGPPGTQQSAAVSLRVCMRLHHVCEKFCTSNWSSSKALVWVSAVWLLYASVIEDICCGVLMKCNAYLHLSLNGLACTQPVLIQQRRGYRAYLNPGERPWTRQAVSSPRIFFKIEYISSE